MPRREADSARDSIVTASYALGECLRDYLLVCDRGLLERWAGLDATLAGIFATPLAWPAIAIVGCWRVSICDVAMAWGSTTEQRVGGYDQSADSIRSRPRERQRRISNYRQLSRAQA